MLNGFRRVPSTCVQPLVAHTRKNGAFGGTACAIRRTQLYSTHSFSSISMGDGVASASWSLRDTVTRATVCLVFSDSNDTFHWSDVAVAPSTLTPDLARALQYATQTHAKLLVNRNWISVRARRRRRPKRRPHQTYRTTKMAIFCAERVCRNTGTWILDNG